MPDPTGEKYISIFQKRKLLALFEKYKEAIYYSARKNANNDADVEYLVEQCTMRMIQSYSTIKYFGRYKMLGFISLTVEQISKGTNLGAGGGETNGCA